MPTIISLSCSSESTFNIECSISSTELCNSCCRRPTASKSIVNTLFVHRINANQRDEFYFCHLQSYFFERCLEGIYSVVQIKSSNLLISPIKLGSYYFFD
uniref:AsIV-cont00015-ORF2 n=1 Tax=Apophua simplicipes ichnovirus TaxID=1329648 RepID=S5DMG7_9VIRU|nr:AsIV-cont00015-ORF2 [Apophua simplicipes ichnovirus]